jgi:hypothetical protein
MAASSNRVNAKDEKKKEFRLIFQTLIQRVESGLEYNADAPTRQLILRNAFPGSRSAKTGGE